MIMIDEFLQTLARYTRLPLPTATQQQASSAHLAKFAPMAGLVTGGLSGLAYLAGFTVTGGSPHVGASAAVVTHLLVSGARDEDRLVHLSGGTDGTHPATTGLAVLISTLLLRLFLVAEIAFPLPTILALVAAGAIGRAMQTISLAILPAEGDIDDRPNQQDATTALVTAAVAGVIALLAAGGLTGILVTIAAFAGAIVGGASAFFGSSRNKDAKSSEIAGATAIAAELGALAAMAVFMPTPGV